MFFIFALIFFILFCYGVNMYLVSQERYRDYLVIMDSLDMPADIKELQFSNIIYWWSMAVSVSCWVYCQVKFMLWMTQ